MPVRGANRPKVVAPRPKPKVITRPRSFTLANTEFGETLAAVHARFGKEVATNRVVIPYADRIPTGIFPLDIALSGGWLTSRGSMLYGERSSGKTTIAMMTCVRAQIMYPDQVCVWIDIEGTFDIEWFVKLGGDPERLYVVEPESGENAVDMAQAFASTKEVAVIVTDSIAMLIPMKEIEESSETAMMGVHARLIGNYLRKLNNAMLVERHRGHKILILHINQFRMKIGVVFGDPRTLPGGKALEFCTTQQVETKNKEVLSDKGDIKHNEHSFKITKDKTGGRIREGKFKLVRDPDYNNGLPEGTIDQIKTMHELAGAVGLTDEGRIAFRGYGKWNSAADAQLALLADPEKYAALQWDILMAYRKKWGLSVPTEYED